MLAVDRAGGRTECRNPQHRHEQSRALLLELIRTFSATRKSALRARGLRFDLGVARAALAADELQPRLQPQEATPADRERRDRPGTGRCMKFLTSRSSSEWKLMTASRPPGVEHLNGRAQASAQLPQLVVDEHSQRLERARGRVLSRLAGADRARHQRGQLAGARQRMLGARRDDGLSYATCEALFSQRGNHFANLVEARPSEPGRDWLAACRVHTHVERTVRAEAEAPAPRRRAAAMRRRGRRARPGKVGRARAPARAWRDRQTTHGRA